MESATGDDRLGDLPDELLHRMLSFLPADDAVRTCVLARRWRNLWKFATSLRIHLESCDQESLKAALEFVDHLLLLREVRLIDTCHLHFIHHGYDTLDDHISRFKLWIRHILMCQTRVLHIDINCYSLDGPTFISDYLEVLCLASIAYLEDGFVNLSRCPALKKLEISNCNLGHVGTISSQSVKCLVIVNCEFGYHCRVRIDTPNLHSLHLKVSEDGRSPLLQKMPSLVKAFVESEFSQDCCNYKSHGNGDCGHDNCIGCYGIDGDTDHCVLLQGLSEAHNLVLKSDAETFIFRRDLKFRPVFSNLRTLLLTENWCLPDDFDPLAYMLHHSPMLEKLTLELYFKSGRPKFGIKGRCNSTELSTGISRNLKIVDVKCEVTGEKIVDIKYEVTNERFLTVFKFLGTLGINFNLDEVEILE